jgi:hypothetical protein
VLTTLFGREVRKGIQFAAQQADLVGEQAERPASELVRIILCKDMECLQETSGEEGNVWSIY